MTDNAAESPPPFSSLSLTTQRIEEFGTGASAYFQYECLIAGISVFFCRMVVASHKGEPFLLRLFCALVLAFLAYGKEAYEIICAVELFSYAVPVLLTCRHEHVLLFFGKWLPEKAVRLILVAASAIAAPMLCRFVSSGMFIRMLSLITPRVIRDVVFSLFPIEEFQQAYEMVTVFAESDVLQKQLSNLLFVTFNIQVAMGYLGISFLKKEQARRNDLIRMDLVGVGAKTGLGNNATSEGRNDNEAIVRQKRLEASREFRRGAAPFILGVAIPYMLQIIALGNMNMFAFSCFKDDIHRELRVNRLFDNDSYLSAMSSDSPASPGSYASSMDTVISTTYDIFNRKFFSLPKLALLPGIIIKQPVLLMKISPFIFGSDYIKGRAVAFMTSTIERLEKETKEIDAMRVKVEQYDMKNAELLQRSGQGATQFTRRQWEKLTAAIQQKQVMGQLLRRTKGFFQWLQRNFVFSVLVDCALANLIAVGKIVSADVFVFSRAIEDAVDLVLMRSRAESELARMVTEVDRLHDLADVWEKSRNRTLLPCRVASPEDESHGVVIRKLQYSRGTAMVQVDHIELPPGIYALTGSNGSGKSTLFRLLMSCDTNLKSIELPDSILLLTPEQPPISDEDVMEDSCTASDEGGETESEAEAATIPVTMPSSDVAEISQNFYWPLYTRPIDWIYQQDLSRVSRNPRHEMVRRAAEELQVLAFIQPLTAVDDPLSENVTKPALPPANLTLNMIMEDLNDEKEDWFGDLSGGQKSKVELVRKVFLHRDCPKVLLIDETMAPLDPASKSLVMSKLKSFCKDSVVIVIYHTDVGTGGAKNGDVDVVECVPSNSFFDHNIHLENHILTRRKVC